MQIPGTAADTEHAPTLAARLFMENAMRAALRVFAFIAVFFWAWPSLATAQPVSPPPNQQQNFTPGELVSAGQQFFGTVSRGLASVIETAVSQWGLPNGYVLGEEGGGAFFVALPLGATRAPAPAGEC